MVLNTLLAIKMTIKLKHCVWNFQQWVDMLNIFMKLRIQTFWLKMIHKRHIRFGKVEAYKSHRNDKYIKEAYKC